MSMFKGLKKDLKKIKKGAKKLIKEGEHLVEDEIHDVESLKEIGKALIEIEKDAKKLEDSEVQRKLAKQAVSEFERHQEVYQLLGSVAHDLNRSKTKKALKHDIIIPIITRKHTGKKAKGLIDQFFDHEALAPLGSDREGATVPGRQPDGPITRLLGSHVTFTVGLAGDVEWIAGVQAGAGVARQWNNESHAAYLYFGGSAGYQFGGAGSILFGAWVRSPAAKIKGGFIGIEGAVEAIEGCSAGGYFDLEWPKDYTKKSFQGLSAGPGIGVEAGIDLAAGYLWALKL